MAPGSHLHIVTDQHNLDANIPVDLKIQTPNTFYNMAYQQNDSEALQPAPRISQRSVKASSILNMVVILILSPEFQNTEEFAGKLTHGVNSARYLLRGSNIFGKSPYYKNSYPMFWLTSQPPLSAEYFPSQSFFTRRVEREPVHAVYTTVFIVEVNKYSDSRLILVCGHCSVNNGVKLIIAGFHDRMRKIVEILAPVQLIVAGQGDTVSAYVSKGCINEIQRGNPAISEITRTGFLCGSNLTIFYYYVYTLQTTTHPVIYDEGYTDVGNLEPNANSCPRSVWSNTTIYRENSFRKLDADHEFRLISSPTSAAGFLYLVNLFGRAAAPARFSKMKERGLCLTKFVTKLEEFAFWRHPTLMITRTSAHLLAGFDSTMQKLLSKELPDSYEDVLAYSLLFPYDREYLPDDWVSRLNDTQLETVFEEELLKCGRTAWVDHTVPLKEKFDHLSRHYYWKKFFMGKHPFLRRMRGLQLHNEGISRLGRRISAFVESGCYHYQQTLLSKLGSSKMSNHTKDKLAKMSRPSLFEPLNLSKSISTYGGSWVCNLSDNCKKNYG
ncbi:hypothetical protein Fcan01_28079 [Folsomia candida]|uniref:Uncharacterized protein n=1 Tax=Folsomia candida TaxID=158441 RepID=A0A226CWK8_FOLCA|nr:hypothetical protein Fcan01_28079 [Folsomia candida]